MKKLNLNTIAIKFKKIYNQDDVTSLYKVATTLVFILGLTAFLIQFRKPPQNNLPAQRESIDTYIPKDQRLLTIEVLNYESLDQIIGQFALVDLYTQALISGEKARLVMPQVKLMRNPRSPRHFNILLEPQDVSRIASHSGEFIIAISNPKFVGTKFVKQRVEKRKILVDEESI